MDIIYEIRRRHSLQNQQPPVSKIDLHDLENSQIDWSHYHAKSKPTLKTKKQLRDHQRIALDAVKRGLSDADRGKLIMACGTGKTFTALKIAEELAGTLRGPIMHRPLFRVLSKTIYRASEIWSQKLAGATAHSSVHVVLNRRDRLESRRFHTNLLIFVMTISDLELNFVDRKDRHVARSSIHDYDFEARHEPIPCRLE